MAQAIYTTTQLISAGAIVLFLLSIILWVMWGARNSEETVTFQASHSTLIGKSGEVRILRGGARVDKRLKFKVRIINETQYPISDVVIKLEEYPFNELELAGSVDEFLFSEIAAGHLKESTFEFIAVSEILSGELVASVMYNDVAQNFIGYRTRPYTLK
jgi:hypothetical protein